MSLQYAQEGKINSMFWSSLPQMAITLRETVVEALGESGRMLHLGGGATIGSGDLVKLAARKRLGSGVSSSDYLRSVYALGEYSDGAELVALVNQLRMPARVYQPRLRALAGPSNRTDGISSTIELVQIAALGFPVFGSASALHLLALDSLQWECKDDEAGIVPRSADSSSRGPMADGLVLRGEDRGVSFHSLLPTRLPERPRPGLDPNDGLDAMRARIADSPEALAAIREAAKDPRFASVIAEIARNPARAAEYAKDPELGKVLSLVLAKMGRRASESD